MTKRYTSILLILFVFSFPQQSPAQKTDTVFILKDDTHSIFIDPSRKSTFYTRISDFTFGEFDHASYAQSLEYLKLRGIKLVKNNIGDIPKKWVIAYRYKNAFYTYHPSDFYSHFKILITDTAFIDFSGEGPCANKIILYKKTDEKTVSFSLTGMERPNRILTIHIIDKQKGIAVFEELINQKDKIYYLMVDIEKINRLPIIVNYCTIQKEMELDFDEPDFTKLIAPAKSKKPTMARLK